VEQFCDYLLENYMNTDSNCSSASVVRMICFIIEDHKRMWAIPCPFQCHISQRTSGYFCFCICIQIYRMRPTSKRESWLHEDLKGYSQKRGFRLLKLWSTELTRFRKSKLFHECPLKFYQIVLYCLHLLATSLTVNNVGQNNRYYECQNTVS